MNVEMLKNRRRIRETLVSAFYAEELSQNGLDLFINNESFTDWLCEVLKDENYDLVMGKLETVFDDVRSRKLESEDVVSFQLPNSNADFSITFKELDVENKNDGFSALTKRILETYDFAEVKGDLDEVKDTEVFKTNTEFYKKYLSLYRDNLEEIDNLIVEKVNNWDYSRVAFMDKIIIRMGIVELKYFPDIPPKVTINEAVELGKKFSTPKSKLFINGVLNTLMDI